VSLLEVDGVDAYYGESHILRDLSMGIDEEEICALLGRNGAGKSTTLRSIAGATPPEVRDGEVRFKGKRVTGERTEDIVMSGIALVPEERRVFTNLTVEENLHLSQVSRNRSNVVGRGLGQVRDTRPLSEIYEAFPRLDERQNQLAGTLSGGEQQMLAIARALVAGADLLLLDEPTEGLAPFVVRQVEDLVESLNDEGIAVLLVEQNVEVALELADRHYVLDRGEIVYHGTSEQLREDEEVMDRHLGVTSG